MRYNGILFCTLLTLAAAAANAQEGSPLTQLDQTAPAPAVEAAVEPVAAPSLSPLLPAVPKKEVSAPIGNFAVAILKAGGRARQEGMLFRGSNPETEADFKFLAGLGIETVINLHFPFDEREKNLCADNKLDCAGYGIIPLAGVKLHERGAFKKAFRRAVDDMKAGKKVFVYCLGGRHRTSALVTALTIREAACGKPYNKEELNSYLDKTLVEYGFHNQIGKTLFTSWKEEMHDWVNNLDDNQWLCR